MASLRSVAVFLLAWCASVAPAASQEAVTVLALDATGETDGLDAQMYDALRAQIEFHRDYTLNDVPPQSLSDLLLAVGCSELTPDCADLLADVTGTSLIAWGAVAVSADTVQVRLTLYDLRGRTEVRTRVHALPIEGLAALRDAAPVIGRSVVYDDAYSLSVLTEPPGADVAINGSPAGVTPLAVERLGPGVYRVDVRATGFEPETQWAVVDIDGAVADFALAEVVPSRDRARGRAADVSAAADVNTVVAADETGSPRAPVARAPAWITAGAGVAVAVAGGVVGLASRATQRTFDDTVSSIALDRSEAAALADQGRRQTRAANVLVVSGAAMAAGGAVWIAMTRGGRDREVAVVAAPLPRGAGVTARVRF